MDLGSLFDLADDTQPYTAAAASPSLPAPPAPRPPHQRVGLYNQGATCYLNTILQMLYMIDEFRHGVFTVDLTEVTWESGRGMLRELQLLFTQLHSMDCVAASTEALTQSFGWLSASARDQHDLQEANLMVLDTLGSVLSGTTQSHLLATLFQGSVVNYTKCHDCHIQSETRQSFWDLTCPVYDSVHSLHDSLSLLFSSEVLHQDNQFFCSSCDGKRDATRGSALASLPGILICSLQRVQFDYDSHRRVKVTKNLTFPLSLVVTPFTLSHLLQDEATRQDELDTQYELDAQYELIGVVLHSGSAYSGHYHAFLRGESRGSDAWRWYDFNDACVTEIEMSWIERAFGGSDCASILYYSRVAGRREQGVAACPPPPWCVAQVQCLNVAMQRERDDYERLRHAVTLLVIKDEDGLIAVTHGVLSIQSMDAASLLPSLPSVTIDSRHSSELSALLSPAYPMLSALRLVSASCPVILSPRCHFTADSMHTFIHHDSDIYLVWNGFSVNHQSLSLSVDPPLCITLRILYDDDQRVTMTEWMRRDVPLQHVVSLLHVQCTLYCALVGASPVAPGGYWVGDLSAGDEVDVLIDARCQALSHVATFQEVSAAWAPERRAMAVTVCTFENSKIQSHFVSGEETIDELKRVIATQLNIATIDTPLRRLPVPITESTMSAATLAALLASSEVVDELCVSKDVMEGVLFVDTTRLDEETLPIDAVTVRWSLVAFQDGEMKDAYALYRKIDTGSVTVSKRTSLAAVVALLPLPSQTVVMVGALHPHLDRHKDAYLRKFGNNELATYVCAGKVYGESDQCRPLSSLHLTQHPHLVGQLVDKLPSSQCRVLVLTRRYVATRSFSQPIQAWLSPSPHKPSATHYSFAIDDILAHARCHLLVANQNDDEFQFFKFCPPKHYNGSKKCSLWQEVSPQQRVVCNLQEGDVLMIKVKAEDVEGIDDGFTSDQHLSLMLATSTTNDSSYSEKKGKKAIDTVETSFKIWV